MKEKKLVNRFVASLLAVSWLAAAYYYESMYQNPTKRQIDI